MKKEFPQYRSSSSLVSSSNDRYQKNPNYSGQERGRSPNKRSPFTDRKRLYLNKNGERRSISRNRLEVYDDKTKKFVPRPLSRSGDRRSNSSGQKCLLCNSPHSGTCHWYGKIRPTKEACERCGGHHHKSICLGKRSVTPGGSRRSPSASRPDWSRESSKDRGEKEKEKSSKDWFPNFRKNLN